MMSYEDAKAAVKKIAETDPDTYFLMRHEATSAIEGEMADYPEFFGDEIGSSDVSIKVITMFQYGEMEV